MGLDPGERIALKRRIAQTLGQQSWGDVDLTLREFDLPTSDTWGGDDRQAYVLSMIEAVRDVEALRQLDSYLHPSASPSPPPEPETFGQPSEAWTGIGLRLFVSHVHAYAAPAAMLRTELAKRSVDAFVAHDSIEPTAEWQKVIVSALRSCEACVALLTPGFRESVWCDQELGFCMARDLLVIPLEYGQTPYGFLGAYQSLRVYDGQAVADLALAVFELLVKKPQSRRAMADALVRRWESTGSWEAARENYGFLRKIPREAWTQRLVDAVWEARDRVHDLRTANINWESSDVAVERLFADLPFTRSSKQ